MKDKNILAKGRNGPPIYPAPKRNPPAPPPKRNQITIVVKQELKT